MYMYVCMYVFNKGIKKGRITFLYSFDKLNFSQLLCGFEAELLSAMKIYIFVGLSYNFLVEEKSHLHTYISFPANKEWESGQATKLKN